MAGNGFYGWQRVLWLATGFMAKILLGLGSNLGDRAANLENTISALSEHITDMRLSQVWESAAVLPDGAPDDWDIAFYNMAISGHTQHAPDELLAVIKQAEEKVGRIKRDRWAPREIDIDILAYDEQVLSTDALVIPHPHLLKRDFALLPFAELWPNWRYPLPGAYYGKEAASIVSQLAYGESADLKHVHNKINIGGAQQRLATDGSAALAALERKECSLAALERNKLKLVGIINVTPDSFSDGGKWFKPEAALAAISELIEAGADVIDIGAESTRPGATPLTAIEEWQRLEPVLKAIPAIFSGDVKFSLDTYHPENVEKALGHGVSWINDVSGFNSPAMVDAVKNSDCKLVVMHSLSVPADKAIVLPEDADPIKELLAFALQRFGELEHAGVTRDRLIFDPGIGFGKTAEQSQEILRRADELKQLNVPIFIGHSRKSFLGMAGDSIDERDEATVTISRGLATKGIDYLRVHNIKIHKKMLTLSSSGERSESRGSIGVTLCCSGSRIKSGMTKKACE